MVSFEIAHTKVECETRPDLFSPKDLDKGTRLLLERVASIDYTRALDWGCGWGAMSVWLAAHRPRAQVIGLDSDVGAVKVSRHNVLHNQLSNIEILASPGYEDLDEHAKFDLIVSNPPTHRGREVVESMIRESHTRLEPSGQLVFVVEARLKPWVQRELNAVFGSSQVLARTQKHVVLAADK